jgi:mono/diheme cytochrome c family protein
MFSCQRVLKLGVIFVFSVFAAGACFLKPEQKFVIAKSTSYEASLFRQNCAICHGGEGEGKTLDDGTVVPSLRTGGFKAIGEEAVYRQIAEGGNGMLAFRKLLSEREIRALAKLVDGELRKPQ